ncbi:MAG: RNA polymerase sigma factor [Pseudonocardiaceae bacterium]
MAVTIVNTGCTPASTAPSVADLLRRVGQQDPAAWDEIIRRYGPLVAGAVRSFRLQDADALDAAQTTWLRLAEYAHQIRDPEQLGGWLVTTARRACLHILRQAKLTSERFEPMADTIADPSGGPEPHAIDADTTAILWTFVSELSPRRRILLRALFADHPRPYAEIACIAGIPPGGIGPTRARALSQLRIRLEQHGLGPESWR